MKKSATFIAIAFALTACALAPAQTMEQEYQKSLQSKREEEQKNREKIKSFELFIDGEFNRAVKYQCDLRSYLFIDGRVFEAVGSYDNFREIKAEMKFDKRYHKTTPYKFNNGAFRFTSRYSGGDEQFMEINSMNNIRYTKYSDKITKGECEFKGGDFNKFQ